LENKSGKYDLAKVTIYTYGGSQEDCRVRENVIQFFRTGYFFRRVIQKYTKIAPKLHKSYFPYFAINISRPNFAILLNLRWAFKA
jgi:hypothetical protein